MINLKRTSTQEEFNNGEKQILLILGYLMIHFCTKK